MIENKNKICENYKLQENKDLLYWMGSDYLFYHSCENCTESTKCESNNTDLIM